MVRQYCWLSGRPAATHRPERPWLHPRAARLCRLVCGRVHGPPNPGQLSPGIRTSLLDSGLSRLGTRCRSAPCKPDARNLPAQLGVGPAPISPALREEAQFASSLPFMVIRHRLNLAAVMGVVAAGARPLDRGPPAARLSPRPSPHPFRL